MDSYLNQLGISAAVTGADLGSEMLGTVMAISGGFGGKGALGGVSNAVMGVAGKVTSAFDRYTPMGAVRTAARSQAQAYTRTAKEADRAGNAASYQAASEGGSIRDRAMAWAAASTETFKDRETAYNADAAVQSMDGNVFLRKLYGNDD